MFAPVRDCESNVGSGEGAFQSRAANLPYRGGTELVRAADARSPFDDDEGAFDFEEAVFGSADEPRGGRGEG